QIQYLVARKSGQAESDSAWSTEAAHPPPPPAAYLELRAALLTLILLRVTGANVARPFVRLQRLRILGLPPPHRRGVPQDARQRGMGRKQALLHNSDGARIDCRRLAPAPFRAIHFGQVVERDAHALLLRPHRLFQDGERAPVERLRLREAPLQVVERGEV